MHCLCLCMEIDWLMLHADSFNVNISVCMYSYSFKHEEVWNALPVLVVQIDIFLLYCASWERVFNVSST